MEANTHSPTTDAPSLDTTFALLRDHRRRALVSILADERPPVSLTDLAAAVSARESGTAPDEVPPEKADAVATTLHHVHLPRLAESGVVTYDAAEKTVTDTHVEAVAPFSTLGDDF